MIRLSPAQFGLLGRINRQRKPLEKELAADIRQFLELRGWSVFRQQSGVFCRPGNLKARITVGSRGIPDWRAERAVRIPNVPGACQVLWYETKRAGEKPRPEQLLWLDRLRAGGAMAEWFDSREKFTEWYYATVKDLR